MPEQKHLMKMVSNQDDHILIKGYGAIFGGKDLVGDEFTAATNFMKSFYKNPPVLWEHGQDENINHPVGFVVETNVDDIGVEYTVRINKSFPQSYKDELKRSGWKKEQVERQEAYLGMVAEMIEEGELMGFSTAVVPHLYKKSAGKIVQWPVAELTITKTPMEHRTLGVGLKSLAIDRERMKNIMKEIQEELKDTEPAEETPEVTEVAEDQIEEVVEVEEVETQVEETTIEKEEDDMSKEELEKVTTSVGELTELVKSLATDLKETKEGLKAVEDTPADGLPGEGLKSAPAVLKHGLGESGLIKAWAAGDAGPNLVLDGGGSSSGGLKASNDTDMNIGTPADGGNMTKDGFYNQIIMKMRDSDLLSSLPVFRVPGSDTTVDIPVMGGEFEQFVTTAEAAEYDRDAPIVNKKQSTIVWRTKYVDISNQLLHTAANQGGVDGLLSNYFGQAMAETRNQMVVDEVLANGTSFKTFAAANAIAFGELEDILGNPILSNYLTSDSGIKWVMNNQTLWTIRQIVGADRQYYMDHSSEQLLGYDVLRTQRMPVIGAAAKVAMFGNWNHFAFRESPSLTLQRDPYSMAKFGQVRITAHFGAAVNLLQEEAIGFAEMAA